MPSAAPLAATQAPPFGRLQKPAGVTEPGQRADFRPDPFEIAIAAHGYRLGWTRRAECPCQPVSHQLTAANPNCSLCGGDGFLYFGPGRPQDISAEGLTDVQQAALARSNAFLIRGMMTGLSAGDSHVDRAGYWTRGASQVTVNCDNKLGYRDRLVLLDGELTYSEVVVMPAAPALALPLRYVVSGGVYLCRSVDRAWEPQRDFVVEAGIMRFFPGAAPAPGTRVSVHYLTYPVYLVDQIAHRIRTQNLLAQVQRPLSPEGDLARLPLQAQVVLEFLPSVANDGAG